MGAEGFRYAVASLGLLVALFGAYLILGSARGAGSQKGLRASAWAMLALGLAVFATTLFLPEGRSPPAPAFLREK